MYVLGEGGHAQAEKCRQSSVFHLSFPLKLVIVFPSGGGGIHESTVTTIGLAGTSVSAPLGIAPVATVGRTAPHMLRCCHFATLRVDVSDRSEFVKVQVATTKMGY